MKVIAYAVRPDEIEAFKHFSKELDCEITSVNASLSLDNVALAKGFEYVTILGHCDGSKEVLKELSKLGVKGLSSRSAGYDNIDIACAKELGIRVANAHYSPNCVADFTVMHILMALRKVQVGLTRAQANDFSLRGLQGREMKNMTIGVIGTGRIGQALIKNLSGFGSKVIAYDLYPNERVKEFATYVELEELYKRSDIIALHAPLNDETYHLINKKSLAQMKKGVVLINTARGELVNSNDLIEALNQGQVGAAGLDVLEGEIGTFHTDCRFSPPHFKALALLKAMPQVTITHHFAFYTDQAVFDMVECGLTNLSDLEKGLEPRNRVI